MNTHSTLLLANGASISIPHISETGAGWILKPDEARNDHDIARGLNKSFGRSHEGRKVARDWRREYLQNLFDKADWSPLVGHDYDAEDINSPGGAGITFSVLDPLYGWNVFRFMVEEPSGYYRDKEYKVFISWEGTAIQEWYMKRQVTDAHPYSWTKLYQANQQFPGRDKKIYKMAEEFAKDPLGYVQQETSANLPWNFKEIPPIDWGNLKPVERFLDDAQTFHVQVDKNHVFWRKGDQAQAVFVKATKQIEMLEKAFQHLGIDIRIGTGINWDIIEGEEGYRKTALKSVDFDIPADDQDHQNMRGHHITLNLGEIAVQCGYVQDDKKWEQWKARQAADWLSDFEQETTPTYEDYDHKPN